jgi:cytochrome c biogenesis protein CcmG/thiol:disulfide interchange protein DsbE
MLRYITLAAIALVVVGLLAILSKAVLFPDSGPSTAAPAPDFELTTFEDQVITLSELRGKVVLVNFWASWCIPCEDEAKDLEQVWQEYKDRGVVVLGVNYTDTQPAALDYLSRLGITYPNGPDRGSRISREYGLVGVPETVLIDQSGTVVGLTLNSGSGPEVARITGPIVQGSSFTPDDLRDVLDRLLADGAVDGGEDSDV